MPQWVWKDVGGAIIGAIIGAITGAVVSLYTFHETQTFTKQIESIKLAMELSKEFNSGNDLYRKLRESIESCKPLYKSWGGEYGHDEINRYLDFFDDLGYFEKNGFLDKRIIGHLFGPYIIEAYENKELQKYVNLLRKNFSQPHAFEDYYALAQDIETQEPFRKLTEQAKMMCSAKVKEVPK
jgi:hypothetical protein